MKRSRFNKIAAIFTALAVFFQAGAHSLGFLLLDCDALYPPLFALVQTSRHHPLSYALSGSLSYQRQTF